jgi:hypothetical protein
MKLSVKLEKEVDAAFKKHFNCVQIPMMDLPKIFNETRQRFMAGEAIDAVMEKLSNKYKQINAVGFPS